MKLWFNTNWNPTKGSRVCQGIHLMCSNAHLPRRIHQCIFHDKFRLTFLLI
uniref:Uncharacterized protein n=1 Tax=Lepeophtheirus salmonis TaxID=72036 RepID=A0A0K2U7T7_LEPSM